MTDGLDGFQKSLRPCALDESILSIARLKIKLSFPRDPNCNFTNYLKVLHIETSTSLGSLQKAGGAEGNSRQPWAPG